MIKHILSKLLITAYSFSSRKVFRHQIFWLIIKIESGEMRSPTIRFLMKKHHNVDVGKYSYGCFNYMNIRPGVKIGRYCSFGKNVKVLDANHPIDFISTHPFFYEPSYGYVKKSHIHHIEKEICNDVWFGHNALIMPNVKRIGNGAIIGAGAVVTKDVPDYAIVAGNPAKILRYRFSSETIKKLLSEKWWEEDINKISHRIESFAKPIK